MRLPRRAVSAGPDVTDPDRSDGKMEGKRQVGVGGVQTLDRSRLPRTVQASIGGRLVSARAPTYKKDELMSIPKDRRAAALIAATATAYAAGRMTYAVGECAEAAALLWGDMAEEERIFVSDLLGSRRDLGMSCDEASWEAVFSAMAGEPVAPRQGGGPMWDVVASCAARAWMDRRLPAFGWGDESAFCAALADTADELAPSQRISISAEAAREGRHGIAAALA